MSCCYLPITSFIILLILQDVILSSFMTLFNFFLYHFTCVFLCFFLFIFLYYIYCTSPSFSVFSLRGRFSVLNLCRDIETSQVFAAKITPYQAEKRQLVLREYQLLKRLHHPHLVQLHAAYITSRYLVLVEELCPGKELLYSLAVR